MLDRLFDVLGTAVEYLQIGTTVDQFERGVILRWGRHVRDLEPGFRFHWPLGIERPLTINVNYDTLDLGTQSVTTRDDVSVVLRAYVSFEVFDAKRALLDVDGAESVLPDVASGYIEERVRQSTWEQIRKPGFRPSLKKNIQRQARKWGITVKNVQFSDFTRSKSLRLFNDRGE